MKYKLGDFEIGDIKVSLIICSFFTFICIGYLIYLYSLLGYDMSPELTIPLFLGIIFENKRLEEDIKMSFLKIMLAIIVGSAITGLYTLSLKPLNDILGQWPFIFIFFYALFSAIYHDKKVTARITEGTTLIQSISLLYWIIESDFLSLPNLLKVIILIPVITFTVFSFYNAFTYKVLTKKIRLLLSIWSSIVMGVFAMVYIFNVFQFNQFTNITSLDYMISILQFFLLGVSTLYIAQNLRMIYWYFPSRDGYDDEHKKKIEQFNELHVWRYSNIQIKVKDAILVSFFTLLVYTLNYILNFLPCFTLIWLVFWSAPFVIILKSWLTKNLKKKKH